MYTRLELNEKLGLKKGDHPLRLPKVFSDHMVLQQGKKVPVWGLGRAGDRITVAFAGQEMATECDEYGVWKLELAPMKASFESRTMTVCSSSGESISFEDVLVGEVWLCSGQSNMEMGIKACYDGEKLVAEANHPFLRILTTVNKTSYTPRFDIDHGWDVCTPSSAGQGTFGGFCAIGYFFARRLMEEIEAPIGVINSSWGGTPIRAFIPPEGFALVKGLEGNTYELERKRRYYEAEIENCLENGEAWRQALKKSLEDGEILPPPPRTPSQPTPYENSAIFMTQINPLVPYAIKGFLWYQAEYDVIERPCPESYYQKMHALVKSWRKRWNDELPFYYVQIAPWHYVAIYGHRNEICDAQARALDIPNTGMALAYDTADDLNNIHPRDKRPLAERLANLALYELYGKKDLRPYFPKMREVILEGPKARILFDNTYGALHTADGKDPDCFEVAGQDGQFHPAKAAITGPEEVTVSSDRVGQIAFVQFGRGLLDRANLRSASNLSALSFTTYENLLREGNLAFKKPVTSNFPTYLDCGPEYVTDGIIDNGSAFEGTSLGQWVKIDLLRPEICDTIDVYCYSDGLSAQRYTLEISLDGENWERIANRSLGAPNLPCESASFPAKPVRYVRLTLTYTNRLRPDEYAENNLCLRTYASRTRGPRINEIAVYHRSVRKD